MLLSIIAVSRCFTQRVRFEDMHVLSHKNLQIMAGVAILHFDQIRRSSCGRGAYFCIKGFKKCLVLEMKMFYE